MSWLMLCPVDRTEKEFHEKDIKLTKVYTDVLTIQ